jgi:hypothetical protein
MKTQTPLHSPLGFFSRLAGAVLLLLAPFTIVFGQQEPLGGPYVIGGKQDYPDVNLVQAKVAEFEAFKTIGWEFSKVSELTPSRFTNSVLWNKHSGTPYAKLYQRYNYVVQKKDDRDNSKKDDKDNLQILVATWKERSFFNAICNQKNLPKEYDKRSTEKDVMVNFFPEEPDLPSDKNPPSRSKWPPCVTEYSDSRGTIKSVGILDANSKHFMLAQGLGTTLGRYKKIKRKITGGPDLTEAPGHPWVQTKVLYAGEIIVDVENCRYFINQMSGTYRPKPGDDLKLLIEVANVFTKVLGSSPSLVWTREDSSVRAWPIKADQYKEDLVCPKQNPQEQVER